MTATERALQYIRQHPGCRAHDIADHVSPRRLGWTSQGATRWVAALLRKHIASGAVYRFARNGFNLDYFVSDDARFFL